MVKLREKFNQVTGRQQFESPLKKKKKNKRKNDGATVGSLEKPERES